MNLFAVSPIWQTTAVETYCMDCNGRMELLAQSEHLGLLALCMKPSCPYSTVDTFHPMFSYTDQLQHQHKIHFRVLRGFFGFDPHAFNEFFGVKSPLKRD